MAVHLFESTIAGSPSEPLRLEALTLRLLEDAERERFDAELATKHYLKNATAVGRVLRYVAAYRGQWVALLVFCSPALHLKPRDRWLHWSPRQVKERRHLIAQHARFLVLAAPGQWPNLASRVLKLACARLPRDWQAHFGYPVQVVETFVDPQRFRGTCYQAAGWQPLGPTQGFERDWQDFYTDTQHPKQLWVKPLTERALEQVRAPELPPEWADPQGPRPPACPVPTARLDSLWERFRTHLTDPRDTNEEATVAAHWPQLDLAGVCVTADAAHTTKANGRQLTQNNGAEFLLFLKANQPLALAKAEPLLPGALPPSGPHAGQRPRPP